MALGYAEGIRLYLQSLGRKLHPPLYGDAENRESPPLLTGFEGVEPLHLPFNGELSEDEIRMMEQFAFEDFE